MKRKSPCIWWLFFVYFHRKRGLMNTFFKYNRKFSRVLFIDRKVDNLTYAFLKNGMEKMTGIALID